MHPRMGTWVYDRPIATPRQVVKADYRGGIYSMVIVFVCLTHILVRVCSVLCFIVRHRLIGWLLSAYLANTCIQGFFN